MVYSISEEHVVFDKIIVAMTHRECAAGLEEYISPESVVARLVRNDLQLAVATIEIVILDKRVRVK